jgi:hypothetical protein
MNYALQQPIWIPYPQVAILRSNEAHTLHV